MSLSRPRGTADRYATTRLVSAGVAGLAMAALAIGGFPTVTAQAAKTNLKADQAYARAQLLTLANFPSGWKKAGTASVGTSADSNSAAQTAALASCLGVSPPPTVVTAEARSPFFGSKNAQTQVIDVADVYANKGQAKTDFPPYKNPKYADCVGQVYGSTVLDLEKSLWPSGTTFGTPTASVPRAPRYGDQSTMIMFTIPVTDPSGAQGKDYLDLMGIRQGRSTASLFIDQSNTPPSNSLTKSLATTVTKKMKANPPKR